MKRIGLRRGLGSGNAKNATLWIISPIRLDQVMLPGVLGKKEWRERGDGESGRECMY